MKCHFRLVLLLAVIVLIPFKAFAAELITNGGFETGNFTGWSTAMTQTTAWCSSWVVATSANGCQATVSPLEGTRVAMNGFDGTGGEFRMWQDVAIPAGVSARLTFSFKASWSMSAGSTPRTFEVQVRNTSGAILQTVYSFTTNNIGGGQQTLPWNTQVHWITPYAGQTVRIYFVQVIPQQYTGPGQMEIDNVKLETFFPTAAMVEMGGRIMDANGYGIKNAVVSFFDIDGQLRRSTSNQFGYYSFDDVEAGGTYILTVNHKNRVFSNNPRVLNLSDARKDIDFISTELLQSNENQKRE